MNINEQYFIPMRFGIPNAPLLSWDNDQNIIIDEEPVELVAPLSLCLSDPEPNQPFMADYLRLLNDTVISEKVKKIVESFKMEGVQILPAEVKVDKDEIYHYWHIYIYHRIENCLDLEKSQFSGEPDDIMFMDKIVLNENIKEVPIEFRRIFKLTEFPFREIYHKEIVDNIMSVSPSGLKFWPLTEWTPTSYH